jgi:heme-degrading monooxygenase HmoA
MFRSIWRFQVKQGYEDRFAEMNATDWPSLFRRSPDYLGSAVGKNPDAQRVYVTMDDWRSREAFEKFLVDNISDYETLCMQHKELLEKWEHIGYYDLQTSQ